MLQEQGCDFDPLSSLVILAEALSIDAHPVSHRNTYLSEYLSSVESRPDVRLKTPGQCPLLPRA